MRKPRQLTKARSAQQLLRTLTDSPALPAFVRNLQAPVLKRLIEHVGLHDAGDLIALTTPQQMRDLFEVSLWESLTPGAAERLRPEKFLEWLDVMLDIGPAFAAERLIELGDDFVVLNFASLIEVIDASVMAEHREAEQCVCGLCLLVERGASFELIGEHIVVGVHDDEWDSIRATLVELDGEDAAFLHRVLARICGAPTVRGAADAAEMLLDDETYEREQRRERSGFVTPPLAAVFLKTTTQASRTELAAQLEYDAITLRYFEQIAHQRNATTSASDEAMAQAGGIESDGAEPDEQNLSPVQLRALEEALVQAAVIGAAPMLLAAPQSSREPVLELQLRLDHLQLTRPDLFAARLGELVYLANVLMAGSSYQGARYTEQEAARAALACANLGLECLVAERAHLDAAAHAELVETMLTAPPGIVRLFQVGWNLLQGLPLRSAALLLDALRSDHVRAQLMHKRWILDEIESAVNDPDMLELIERGEFEDVGDNLTLLGLVLDQRACQCLRTLISDFPRYPLQLNLGFRGTRSTNEARYLATLSQLHAVEAFLATIDDLLRI